MSRVRRFLFYSVLALTISNCKPKEPGLAEYIVGWNEFRSVQVLQNSQIAIERKRSKIIPGEGIVIIFTHEKEPLYKDSASSNDAHSFRKILIHLDVSDSIVTASNPGNSKIYREIIAGTPDFGTHELKGEEEIFAKRRLGKIEVQADLYDLQFSGLLSATDSLKFTFKEHHMNHKQ